MLTPEIFTLKISEHYHFLEQLDRPELVFIKEIVDHVLFKHCGFLLASDQEKMESIVGRLEIIHETAPPRTFKTPGDKMNGLINELMYDELKKIEQKRCLFMERLKDPGYPDLGDFFEDTLPPPKPRVSIFRKIQGYLLGLCQRIGSLWKAIIRLPHKLALGVVHDKLKATVQFRKVHSELVGTTHPSQPQDLETARLIFMGENHTIAEQRCMQKSILNQYGANGDFVLLERATGKITSRVSNWAFHLGLSHQFTLQGWDDGTVVEEDRDIRRCKCLNQPIDPQREQTIWEKRNESLHNTVSQLLVAHPKRKIFVIAGAQHVNPNKLDYDVRDKVGLSVNDKAAIVLFSDSFDSDTDDYMEKLTGVSAEEAFAARFPNQGV